MRQESAKSKAVDALVAAGVTSSKTDMAWLVSEIKKREAAATASNAAKASGGAAPAAAAAGQSSARGGGGGQSSARGGGGATSAPILTGKKANDATKEVFKHAERLKYQDEDWKARDEALVRLQKLIVEGALSCDGFVTGGPGPGFAANIKDLVDSVVKQLYDLRSSIVRQATTTLGLLCTECGDHADVERPMKDNVLEGLLQLTSSGNKVLSAAGRDAFPTFIEMARFESLIDGLCGWLRGMKHIPVKLACLSALLQILQTWHLSLIAPAQEALEVTLVEAAANPASEVRGLARQCLLQHLANSPSRAAVLDKLLARYPDTKKQLDKEQPKGGALPPDARPAVQMRTGEEGAARRNGRLQPAVPPPPPASKATKPSLLKRLSTKSMLRVGGDDGGGGGGGGGNALSEMLALKEKMRDGLLSAEEFEKEREAILQAV